MNQSETSLKKVAVLISGRGSNMSALIDAAKSKDYPAKICLVISNRPDAKGLDVARDENIVAIAIDHRQFETREAFEQKLHQTLLDHRIEIITCAGFMRKLTASFTQKWEGSIINIHPSLLPKYKGLNTHQRALEAGDKEHGCSVHFITAELDAGPIIIQASVQVLDGDTPDDLALRVLKEEHRIFPLGLAKVARSHTH